VQHGLAVVGVDCDEIAKAEGGVTCCSLLLHAPEVCHVPGSSAVPKGG
jgi:hypothetical protein